MITYNAETKTLTQDFYLYETSYGFYGKKNKEVTDWWSMKEYGYSRKPKEKEGYKVVKKTLEYPARTASIETLKSLGLKITDVM